MRKKAMRNVSIMTELSTERVELALVDDIKRSINSLRAAINIDEEAIKESRTLYNDLRTMIPNAKERVNSNNRIIQSVKKKIELAEKNLDKVKKAAADLGVNPNQIDGYNDVTKFINDLKETSGNVINFTVTLENLLK